MSIRIYPYHPSLSSLNLVADTITEMPNYYGQSQQQSQQQQQQQQAESAVAGSPVLSAVADVLKLQILLTAFSHASAPTAIFLLILATAYEAANMHLPRLGNLIWNAIKAEPADTANSAPSLNDSTEGAPRAFIQFERSGQSASAPFEHRVAAGTSRAPDTRIEAVLAHVSSLPAARSLRFTGQEFIPNFKGALEIDSDIWFELVRPVAAAGLKEAPTTKESNEITYRLFTLKNDITYIHRFIDRTIEIYEQEKKNKLGSEIYYFDQITNVTDGRYALPTPNGFAAFKKSKFLSNRSLRNVYFSQMDELAGRIDFFMDRREWYDEKGVPHTLGIVMHGHPGCGKTSTIKAIANRTRRHIFNISLSHIKTREALKDLFYNDTIHMFNGERLETINIPIRQRLYVIEDIDAMDSVVMKRSAAPTAAEQRLAAKKKRKQEERKQMMRDLGREDEIVDDELDLATVLNVLDGVRETPGRILILSTNYPERLDEALLRPGRFDMILEYKKHSVEVLTRHMEDFYDIALTQEQITELTHGGCDSKWTPAEASQILFKNIGNVEGAVRDLVKGQPAKMFGYSRFGCAAAATASEEQVPGWGGMDCDIGGPVPYEPFMAISQEELQSVSSISSAESHGPQNEFMPAQEMQSESWIHGEQRKTTLGFPKRREFPAPFNGASMPFLNAFSPSSAIIDGPPKGPSPTKGCDLIINQINKDLGRS